MPRTSSSPRRRKSNSEREPRAIACGPLVGGGNQGEAGRQGSDGDSRGGDDRARSGQHPEPPPRSAIGHVVEGEYELGIDDQPTRVIKAGQTFYEPAGCLHRVSKNPGKVKTRLIAVVLHPRDAKEVAVPESRKD